MTMLNRRHFLHAAALIGALAPVSGIFARDVAALARYGSSAGLKPRGRSLVDLLTDIIIPRTNTPGARDAGATDFIDMMLREWATDQQRERFLSGLAAFDRDVVERTGERFERLEPDARRELVAALDREAFPIPANPPLPFIVAMKSLTLAGYYTSEAGAAEELALNVASASYVPCGRMSEASRAESILPSYKLTAFD